jgi:hypothetical protein
MEFDRMNGNTKWRDAELLELAQLDEYKLLGVSEGAATPEGYTKINVHLYTITNDGRSRPDLWPETHDEHPIDSVYSGVVSLKGLRMVTFSQSSTD